MRHHRLTGPPTRQGAEFCGPAHYYETLVFSSLFDGSR